MWKTTLIVLAALCFGAMLGTAHAQLSWKGSCADSVEQLVPWVQGATQVVVVDMPHQLQSYTYSTRICLLWR